MKSTWKERLKSYLKWAIDSLVILARRTPAGRYAYARIVNHAMEYTQEVNHSGTKLSFSIPNAINEYRVDSFSTKEPETLEWIDAMQEGSIVWDIGANVGLYSCYAAKKRGCKVFAFEPSVFNLELLARNIFNNGLLELVTIVPLPLSDELSINTLNMTTTEWGGALSTFGQNYGHDGQIMQRVFAFPTIGVTMMDAVELLKIPQPDYIKMDVDGIEHLILKEGIQVLSGTKSVLIEINDSFSLQSEDAAMYLRNAGLSLIAKRHSQDVEESREFKNAFNQIWLRTEAHNNPKKGSRL
ncbi:MAG: FkbM family methyltransferase [Burkholderiales bacterium]|nr:FkbM family methyltransferase [Burkholderiales bacterium]